MHTIKLSVAVATYNEEKNIGACLKSVKNIADEIIVVDGQSQDRTVEIAESLGAKVFVVPNQKMFHINKQLSFDKCKGEWILYLDADEIVTPEMASEIKEVLEEKHQEIDLNTNRLFRLHTQNVAARDNVTYSQNPPINGYFVARKNYFLGSYLMHSGVYPDGVIRLFRRGKGYLPCKSVHEQVVIEGGVNWLREPLIHMADPTFQRYMERANRYTSLTAAEYERQSIGKSLPVIVKYMIFRPISVFFQLFLRHKGFMDGFSGLVWSLMSALHYPMAYMKYYESSR